MSWFALALLGALAQATYGYSVKVLLRRASPYLVAGSSFLTASLVLFLIVLCTGVPPLAPGLLPAAAVTVTINIVATILFYRALSGTDLSLCMPLLAFTPVFLILTSFLILGELPSAAGTAGILLVSAGAYLLGLEYRGYRVISIITPFRTLRSDRGVQSMLLVAFLYSISVNYDKEVVAASDPVFASAFVLCMLGIAFLCIACIERKLRREKDHRVPPGGTRAGESDRGSPDRSNQSTNVRDTSSDAIQQSSHRLVRSYAVMDLSSRDTDPVPRGMDPPTHHMNTVRNLQNTDSEPAPGRTIPVPVLSAAIGLVLAVEGIAINTAYTMSIVSYVITVKRLAIFFSVLFGWLLLHEGSIRGRMAGALVMLAGVVVIGLWG